MRAVIFAAALLAGGSGWLLLDTTNEPAPVIRTTAPESASSLRRYRAETAECKKHAKNERAACEAQARSRVLGKLKQEAARVSLR